MVSGIHAPTFLLRHLSELTYLDLTACIFAEFSLKALIDLPKLKALILFNVWPLDHEFPTLCKLKNLETLDLSVSRANVDGNYLTPNKVSSQILSAFASQIKYLDLFVILSYWQI